MLLISCHLAFGAGGPQRRKVPTPARLAQLRNEALKANEVEREGRNLATVFPFVGGNRGLPRARFFGEEPEIVDHGHHGDHHHDHHIHDQHHHDHQHELEHSHHLRNELDNRISR